MTAADIHRLRDVDAALASLIGAHLGELAARHGVSTKTIRRDIDLLRKVCGPVECQQVSANNKPGHSWRHNYSHARRLFADGAQ